MCLKWPHQLFRVQNIPGTYFVSESLWYQKGRSKQKGLFASQDERWCTFALCDYFV